MLCGRCGASVADDAAFCPRCGTPLGGAASGSVAQREQLALEAFRRGRSASGVQCPACGRIGMRTLRCDAEENLFWSGVFIVVGIVSLIIVFIGGDAGLLVADLSTIALVCILVGVGLFAVARWRRRPSAYECPDCGRRVP